MQILQLISSARGAESFSTRLSQGIIDKLLAAHPGSTVVVRDLAQRPFPHLEEAHLQAYFAPAESRSPEQQQAVRHSDHYVLAQGVARPPHAGQYHVSLHSGRPRRANYWEKGVRCPVERGHLFRGADAAL
jgi:hypothetical protein